MKYVIGIDGNEANVVNRVGSNVFAYELLQAMEKYLQDHPVFDVVVYLSQLPQADLPVERPGWRYEIVPHQPLWGVWRLPLALWQQRHIDLFFSPGHYLPLVAPVPLVSTIMDLAYEKFPSYFRTKDLYQLKWLTRWGVQRAQHILAISEATKQDLVALYHQAASKISVVYPAVKKVRPVSAGAAQKTLADLDLSAPYILFVGTLQPRKNLVRLIEAFAQLKTDGFPGQLVLAGKVGWQAEPILAAMAQSPVASDIRHLGFVTNEQKQALVQAAEMLVLPGLYEGFGLPSLEAIQLSTLPVVSNVSSLPEVVPIRELRFDPYDIDDLAQTLRQVWQTSPAEKASWLRDLQQHAQQFSWATSAEKTCQILLEQLEKQHEDSRR